MWGRGPRENTATCRALGRLSATSLAIHKQIGPFWCWFPGGWFCVHSRTLWVSAWNPPVSLGVSPAASTPTDVFQSEVLRLYFPTLEPSVAQSALLPSCSSQFICKQMEDCLVCQLPPCHESSPPWLPVSSPPSSLYECFFFNFLVVGLPYSSIFWQFWSFFVFKFVVVLLLVVWGGKMYLPMPSSWPEAEVLF